MSLHPILIPAVIPHHLRLGSESEYVSFDLAKCIPDIVSFIHTSRDQPQWTPSAVFSLY